MTKKAAFPFLIFTLVASVSLAGMVVSSIDAVPKTGHAVITAKGDVDSGSPALFFRRKGHGDFYAVSMVRRETGDWFAVLPTPLSGTDAIEYYVAPSMTAASGTIHTAPVRDVEVSLTKPQQEVAADLVVFDTTAAQAGHGLAWFEAGSIHSHRSLAPAAGGVSSQGNANPAGGSGDGLSNVIEVGKPGPIDEKEQTLYRP